MKGRFYHPDGSFIILMEKSRAQPGHGFCASVAQVRRKCVLETRTALKGVRRIGPIRAYFIGGDVMHQARIHQ